MNEETLITEKALDERLEQFGKNMRSSLRTEMSEMIATADIRHRTELVQAVDGMRAGIEARMNIQDRQHDQRFREMANDIQLVASTVAGLREDLYGDPNQRSGPKSLYERLDEMDSGITKQVQSLSVEVITRLSKVEGWIARRTAVERAVLKVVRAPIVLFLRRFVPWAALVVVILGATMALAEVMR